MECVKISFVRPLVNYWWGDTWGVGGMIQFKHHGREHNGERAEGWDIWAARLVCIDAGVVAWLLSIVFLKPIVPPLDLLLSLPLSRDSQKNKYHQRAVRVLCSTQAQLSDQCCSVPSVATTRLLQVCSPSSLSSSLLAMFIVKICFCYVCT
jgi:hypothetical protein